MIPYYSLTLPLQKCTSGLFFFPQLHTNRLKNGMIFPACFMIITKRPMFFMLMIAQ